MEKFAKMDRRILRMEAKKSKITDLINDALEEEDCEFQIKFFSLEE